MNTIDALDSVNSVSHSISDYGVWPVILAVIIVVFLISILGFMNIYFRNMNTIIKENKIYSDKLLKQNEELMGSILSCKEAEHCYDTEDIVEIFVKLDITLKGHCKATLEKTKCSRLAVYVFHNGMSSSHGLPFFKLSCISEWIERCSGMKNKVLEHTNIPVNIFEPIVSGLYNDGTLTFINLDAEDDAAVDSFVACKKVQTCLFASIYDSNNRVMGFVVAEYCSMETVEKSKDDMLKIRELCSKLQPILEYSNYQSKSSGGK